MTLSNFALTTEDSTNYQRRIGIPYPSSLTYLTLQVKQRSTQKSIFNMLTTWFALPKVMSGKPPSGLAMAHMSGR